MNVIVSPRLALRELVASDAPFVLDLVNQPSWLRYIGDKGVRSLDDARRYIDEGPRAMYARHGFGLYAVTPRQGGGPLGLCGLIKRDALPDVDIGFAFLPQHWGAGYAVEAAQATIDHARGVLGLGRLLAITSLDNDSSIRLLARLGFAFEGLMRLTPQAEEVRLFALSLSSR